MVDRGKRHWRTRKPINKPFVVIDYTKDMRLINKCDSTSTGCMRKSTSWNSKLFFHLVDISMLNAYNIWLIIHESNPTKKLMLREFLYNVALQLLEGTVRTAYQSHRRSPPSRLTRQTTGGRKETLSSLHRHCERTKDITTMFVYRHTTRRQQKRTRVTVVCKVCNVGLCIRDCFEQYHSLKDFWD